jgi:hypothetical protein
MCALFCAELGCGNGPASVSSVSAAGDGGLGGSGFASFGTGLPAVAAGTAAFDASATVAAVYELAR